MENIKFRFAEEGCHFYHPSGEPCYQIEYADKRRKGEYRGTTLRDAKKIGLYPSVTTIVIVEAKPQLMNWMKGEYAKASLKVILPILQEVYKERNYSILSPTEFRDVVMQEILPDATSIISEEGSRRGAETAERGSQIHGFIESYVSGENMSGTPEIKGCIDSFNKILNYLNVPLKSLSSEKSLVMLGNKGFAGKIDLFSEK